MAGYAAIFLAFLTTGAAAIFYLKACLNQSIQSEGKPASSSETRGTLLCRAAFWMILLASAYLYYAIFNDNFRYVYVFNYSSRDQALVYKLSAFWAGQEGSFLLWALFHSGFGLALARKRAPVVMVTYCCLQLFLLVILLTKSPFMPLPEVQPDGMGLNPLLKDPWMVIHPPVVFLGYAALAVPYAWAIHGFITGRCKEVIAQMLPWTLLSWVSLGTGIFIGGFWAYQVLGWGGYWAWDPVENSSLVPWLITGVLLHLLLLARVRKTSVKWAYLAALINFVLVLYGTYLTRSGVLQDFSVHSFSDEGTGGLLTGGVLLSAAGAFSVLIWCWNSLPDGPLFQAVQSREFSLLAAASLLAIVGTIVFIGMSTPLLTRFMGNPQSVSMSFYNNTSLPLAAVIVLLLAAGSSLPWGEYPRLRWHKRWWLLAVALIVPLVAATVFRLQSLLALITIGFAAAAIAATVTSIRDKMLSWPAGLSHIGVAITLIGIVCSSFGNQSVAVSFEQGERHEVWGTGITYLGKADSVEGKGYYHRFKLDNPAALLLPYIKQNEAGGPAVHQPGIYRGLTADIYLAPVFKDESGQRLNLGKGTIVAAEGVKIKFVRFAMEEAGADDMKVYALFAVTQNGVTEEVKSGIMPHKGQMIAIPGEAFNRYEITLTSFNISKGMAGITLADLMPSKRESVEAEISHKPLINLVWLGTVLIAFGTGWAAIKRSRRLLADNNKTFK